MFMEGKGTSRGDTIQFSAWTSVRWFSINTGIVLHMITAGMAWVPPTQSGQWPLLWRRVLEVVQILLPFALDNEGECGGKPRWLGFCEVVRGPRTISMHEKLGHISIFNREHESSEQSRVNIVPRYIHLDETCLSRVFSMSPKVPRYIHLKSA